MKAICSLFRDRSFPLTFSMSKARCLVAFSPAGGKSAFSCPQNFAAAPDALETASAAQRRPDLHRLLGRASLAGIWSELVREKLVLFCCCKQNVKQDCWAQSLGVRFAQTGCYPCFVQALSRISGAASFLFFGGRSCFCTRRHEPEVRVSPKRSSSSCTRDKLTVS